MSTSTTSKSWRVAERAVVIVGYAGHGRVCARALRDAGYAVVGYCDLRAGDTGASALPYLGTEGDWLAGGRYADAAFFVGIGANARRRAVGEGLLVRRRACPAAVQRGAYVAEDAEAAELTLVAAGATVQVGARLGRGCIVNTGASVDHDCAVGAYAHVAPNATLAGGVSVGAEAFVGANATVLPGLSVGAGAILGAGSVLLSDLPAGQTWVGNPARPLKRPRA